VIYTGIEVNMPIKIQNALPAKHELEEENIFVMDESRALSQDFRELQIAILNLMPIKQDTELQFNIVKLTVNDVFYNNSSFPASLMNSYLILHYRLM